MSRTPLEPKPRTPFFASRADASRADASRAAASRAGASRADAFHSPPLRPATLRPASLRAATLSGDGTVATSGDTIGAGATASTGASARLSWGNAQLVAWGILASLSLVLTATRSGPIAGGVRTRVLQCFYGVGQLLAAGVIVGAATLAFRARGSRSMVWTVVATFAAAFTLGWIVLKNNFEQGANHLAQIAPPLFWRGLFTVACATAIPAALLVGRLLSARRRVAGVLGGMVFFVVARNYVHPQTIPGTHLVEILGTVITISSAALIGGSLGGATVPSPLAGVFARSPVARWLPWALSGVWGAYAVLVPPPPQVAFELLRRPTAIFAPFIAELHVPPVDLDRTPEEVAAALVAEPGGLAMAPAVPPSQRALLRPDGVVVLVTIDCLRADVIASDAHAAALPNLVGMRRTSAHFTQARSAGNMTIVGLGSLFTGRYESQLAWSERPTRTSRYLFPADDVSPRFPEVLAARGIPSTALSSIEWLNARNGLLRGFTEEHVLGQARGFANGEEVVSAAIERIERQGAGPLFLFMHLLDAHHPYNRAGTEGTERERYLRELAIVDRELGRLFGAIDRSFGERAVVMVSADHGEAFDEHQTSRHGQNVYDEAVHVPLLVRGPGIVPRAIHDSVSTIDLGPTILDLFRLPTPPTFMGQTLAPALGGEAVVRAHPVSVETRAHVATIDKGWKIIRRKRYGTVELYHLATDPEELDNVFREGDADARARLDAMDTFFDDARKK